MLLSDQSRQRGDRDGRITSQLDLGKSPGSEFRGECQIADHGNLGASAQAMAVDGGDGHLFRANQRADYAVELREHLLNFVGSVGSNVDPAGKSSLRSANNQNRD